MKSELILYKQRGVALITAMLVVAAATMAAAAMVSRQQVDIRRTENMINRDQALQYAYAAESWAAQILEQDLEDNKIDSPQDDWATLLPPMVVEGGAVSGSIIDLQGRFNINNLVKADGTPDTIELARLQRLFTQLDINPEIAHAIIDWIDNNSDPQIPGGAEDDVYLSLTPAYRCANQPLASISELRTIQGITPEIYSKLLPYLIALPERTPLNINSAAPELLATLSDDLSLEIIDPLAVSGEVNPYESVNALLTQESLAGMTIIDGNLSVDSSYFMLNGHAQIGRNRVQLHTILKRQGETAKPVQRSFGTE